MRASLPPFLLLLILILHSNYLSLALNQEGVYLQRAKLSLSDPAGALASWSGGDATPCNWTGVTCNKMGSVVSVALDSASLAGSFPIHFCRLPSLSNLSLPNNSINSTLPDSISACRNLISLDLSQNLLEGPIPPTISDLHLLRFVKVSIFTAEVKKKGMEILRGIFVSSSLRNEHVIGCIINCHLIGRTIVSVIIYDGIMPFRFQLNAQMPCSSNFLHISQSLLKFCFPLFFFL